MKLEPIQLESVVTQVVERLRTALDPLAIYLFGSYAYGTPGPHSDLDLLVVVPDQARSISDLDSAAYRALCGLGVTKDVMVYTASDFERRATWPVSFERTVRTKGRLLYAA
jgi:predicted nucleotidyltransferase